MGNYKFFYPPKGEDSHHTYHSLVEKKIKSIDYPFKNFIDHQIIGSALLILATIIAIFWASMPSIVASYSNFISSSFGLHMYKMDYVKPITFWVNDILLTIFFFFIGLEVKKDFIAGEISSFKKIALVGFGSVGGIVVPLLLFFTINYHSQNSSAWGIVIPTDTAFALGILCLFKKFIPKQAFVFLALLSVFDDIFAIVIIAVFYSSTIQAIWLIASVASLLILVLLNYVGYRKFFLYLIFGLMLWVSLEYANIHGTIAGVLVALITPSRPEIGPNFFISKMKNLIHKFERRKEAFPKVIEDSSQFEMLLTAKEVVEKTATPLQKWSRNLDLPVTLLVLPLFALINAGVNINNNLSIENLSAPLFFSIIIALAIGKPLGITLLSAIAMKLKVGSMLKNINLHTIFFISIFAGIGFTMSLFIATLHFEQQAAELAIAKTAILVSASISMIIGFCYFFGCWIYKTLKA